MVRCGCWYRIRRRKCAGVYIERVLLGPPSHAARITTLPPMSTFAADMLIVKPYGAIMLLDIIVVELEEEDVLETVDVMVDVMVDVETLEDDTVETTDVEDDELEVGWNVLIRWLSGSLRVWS